MAAEEPRFETVMQEAEFDVRQYSVLIVAQSGGLNTEGRTQEEAQAQAAWMRLPRHWALRWGSWPVAIAASAQT